MVFLVLITIAFDSIDHKLLLSKLIQYKVAVTLECCINYFEKQKQYVELSNNTGPAKLKVMVKLGMPQGSCFDPLFNVFMVDSIMELQYLQVEFSFKIDVVAESMLEAQ